MCACTCVHCVCVCMCMCLRMCVYVYVCLCHCAEIYAYMRIYIYVLRGLPGLSPQAAGNGTEFLGKRTCASRLTLWFWERYGMLRRASAILGCDLSGVMFPGNFLHRKAKAGLMTLPSQDLSSPPREAVGDALVRPHQWRLYPPKGH